MSQDLLYGDGLDTGTSGGGPTPGDVAGALLWGVSFYFCRCVEAAEMLPSDVSALETKVLAQAAAFCTAARCSCCCCSSGTSTRSGPRIGCCACWARQQDSGEHDASATLICGQPAAWCASSQWSQVVTCIRSICRDSLTCCVPVEPRQETSPSCVDVAVSMM